MIVENNKIYPIEIKNGKESSNVNKNLSALEKFNLEVQPMLIMCMSENIIPYNRNSYYIPISII